MTGKANIELDAADLPIDRARKAWLYMGFAKDMHNQIDKLAVILDGYQRLDATAMKVRQETSGG